MPKTTLVVKNFQKGLNTKLDDRDLTPGDLSQAINVDVSTAGRIKCLGDLERPHIKDPDTSAISAGYGIFAFAHDYDMYSGTDTSVATMFKDSPAQNNTDYLVKMSGQQVQIYDFTNEGWTDLGNILTVTDTGTYPNATYEPNAYSVDGGVRFHNGANPQDVPLYLGHVNRTYFGDTDKAYNRWVLSDAHPAPPPNAEAYGVQIYPFTNSHWDDASSDHPQATVVGYGFEDDELGTWDISGGNYPKFYASYVYDNGQESTLTEITNTSPYNKTIAANGTDGVSNNMVLHMGICIQHDSGSYANSEANTNARWSPAYKTIRLRGVKIYFSLIKDPSESKYLLLDADFVKGVKKADSSTHESWNEETTNSDYECPSGCFDNNFSHTTPSAGATFIFKDPPTIYSYESQTGHFGDETTSATFKTSCLLNRKLYIGNVYQDGLASNDRMIKSPVNSFDKFPELSTIDAAINDGDDIVKLVSFGDRILQYKRKALHVINASQDQEFLEATYALMGVDRPYQVVETPYGVAWCNRSGVYIYGGEGSITNIVRDKLDIIKDWDWQQDSSGRGLASIGFDDRSDKIIIMRNVAANGDRADEILVYDMRTKAWVFGDDKCTSAAAKSNMFLSPDGYMVYTYDGSSGGVDVSIDDVEVGGGLPLFRSPVRFVRNTISTPDGETGIKDLSIYILQDSNTDVGSTTFNNLVVGDFLSVINSGFADKTKDGVPSGFRSLDEDGPAFSDSIALWKTFIGTSDASHSLDTANNDGVYKVTGISQTTTAYDGMNNTQYTDWTVLTLSVASSSAHLSDFNFAGAYDSTGTDITISCSNVSHEADAPTTGKKCLKFTTSGAHGLRTGMTVFYSSGGRTGGTDSNDFGDLKELTADNGGATVVTASDTTFYLISNCSYTGNSHDLEAGDVLGHILALGSSSAYNSGSPDRVSTNMVFTYNLNQVVGFMQPHIGLHWNPSSGSDRAIRFTVSNLLRWDDNPAETTKYQWKTREIDFKSPGVRKKIYCIYVTFKSVRIVTNESGDTSSSPVTQSNVKVKFHWIGPTGDAGVSIPDNASVHTNYLSGSGFNMPNESDFVTAKIKPETNSGSASENLPNNIYSLKLEFYADGTVPNGFEINDVTVIYRQKSVK